MKRLITLAVLLVMVGALIAPMHAAKADSRSLEVYITGLTDDTLKWFNTTVKPAFEAANPGVTVSFQTGGWGDFDATVQGWLTTGSGPDVVYLGSEYASTYGKVLADMSSYFKDWPDLKNYLPASLQTATYDGALRGLPILMSPRPVYYRSDLVKDFKAPATFADAVKFAGDNTVVKSGALAQQGYMDIGGGLFDWQEFIANLWADGGELYNADGTSAFDSTQTAAALQYMHDRRRAVLPDEKTAGLPQYQGTPLGSNLVVSGIFPLWNAPATNPDDKLWSNIDIEPMPAGPDKGGKQLIQVFTDWLSVPAYSKNQDLAAAFLKFIGTKDYALQLSKVAGWTPVRTDAWGDLKSGSKVWTKLLDIAQKYGRGFNNVNDSAALSKLIITQGTLFVTDQQSLADTQANLKSQYDALLEKDGYVGAAEATPAATSAQ